MTQPASQAFAALSRLREQAIARRDQALPLNASVATAQGLAFVINGQRFICNADAVREIAVSPSIIPLPQTKAWMRGIVNSKGVLLSVVDLSMLAGSTRPTSTPRNAGHLMVLRDQGQQCACLVSRVMGFRAFELPEADSMEDSVSSDWEGLSAFIRTVPSDESEPLLYLDIERLAQSEVFLEVQ